MTTEDYSEILRDAKRLNRLKSSTGVAYPTGYVVFRGLVTILSRFFIRTELYRQGQIPQPGGVKYRPKWYMRNSRSKIDNHAYIIAANHGEVWDIPFIGMFRRGLVWVCKPAFCKNWLLAMINQRMGAVPIFRPGVDDRVTAKNTPAVISQTRQTAYTAEEGLEIALSAMRRGVPVVMFPEGTRAGKSIVDHSKSGTARLSRMSGKPILPIAMAGCSKGDPVVRKGFLRRKVIVGVVCSPIYPSNFEGLQDDKAINTAIMNEWQSRINVGRLLAIGILEQL